MKRFFILLSLFLIPALSPVLHAQHMGLRTNMLYWSTTTPNLGIEFRTGKQTSLSIAGAYNPFNFPSARRADGTALNSKLRHWLVMPEFKYWPCRTFERGNWGLHAIYGEFNIGGIPLIEALKEHRYQGSAWGGGFSWGYQWVTGKRWGMEFSVGAGYLHIQYKKYDCGTCGEYIGEYRQNYFGPTKAALSLIYYIN